MGPKWVQNVFKKTMLITMLITMRIARITPNSPLPGSCECSYLVLSGMSSRVCVTLIAVLDFHAIHVLRSHVLSQVTLLERKW